MSDTNFYLPVNIELTTNFAKMPVYSTEGAAGFDFFAAHDAVVEMGHPKTISTDLKIEVPPGFVLLLFSRSGHGFNEAIRLGNCVGVIDSDYRGILKFRITKDPSDKNYHRYQILRGDKIGQGIIMPYPKVSFNITKVSSSKRGENGIGSTGR